MKKTSKQAQDFPTSKQSSAKKKQFKAMGLGNKTMIKTH